MRAWGAEEGAALQTIDDEFDDFEDEGGEGGGEAGAGPADATAAGGRAGAHEVDYEHFESSVYPRLLKELGRLERVKNESQPESVGLTPSLLWAEIVSFIKGSLPALAALDGCLSREQYMEVGKKKSHLSPSQRATVYRIFELYK